MAELPSRSVRSRLPRCPRPAPPLRLLSNTVCRPPRTLRPVIVPPVSVAAPPVPVTVPPETVLTRPRSYSAVEPLNADKVKVPPPGGGVVSSVMTRRLLVESIEATSSPGAAALISLTIWPRVVGGVPVVLPEAMGASSIVPWSPLASVYPMSGSTLLVNTPAPSFSTLRSRSEERLRIWSPSAVVAVPPTLTPARPREAAVVPLPTSWTLRFAVAQSGLYCRSSRCGCRRRPRSRWPCRCC